MNLNAFNLGMPFKWLPPKILLIMKLIIVLMISFLMQVSAAGYGQKINIDKNNTSLKEVLENIKKQTGYVFFSKDYDLKQAKISVKLKDADIDEALEACLKGLPLSYKIVDKTVFVQLKEKTFLERVVATLNNTDASGRVVDSENRPLPGASVKVKKTGKGVSTDKDGRFFLRGVEEGAVLLVSFVGYLPKEVNASANMGNVVLEQSLSKLDEVQVIAYGTTTRRLSTGNIGTVKAEDIGKQPVSNPLLALQGRVPGVFIEQSSGISGGDVKVRIQGQNSMQKGNEAFYVIDGVPYQSQNLKSGVGGPIYGTGSTLSFINPSDIESVDFLKDADATAIYGSRAANGAILITTKKGKTGETKVDLSIQNGWGQVTRMIDLMNTDQYLAMRREALKNDNALPGPSDYDINGVWDEHRYTDWQKELIGGKAYYNNLQASISGGNVQTQFLASAGYNRQTTVFPGDFSDKKANFHFNLNNTSQNQKFKFSLTSSYMQDVNRLPVADLTSFAVILAPNAPAVYNSDGSINWAPLNNDPLSPITFSTNPMGQLLRKNLVKTNNLISSSLLSYEIMSGLLIRSNFGYNRLQMDELNTIPNSSYSPSFTNYGTRNVRQANYGARYIDSWIIEPQLTYSKEFNFGHIEGLLGSTFQKSKNSVEAFQGMGYANDSQLENSLAATSIIASPNTMQSDYRYSAVFGRLNYMYKEKYIVNATIRRDGSSRFGSENMFNNFYSIGGAWLFVEEKLFKHNISFINYGKLRITYGTTGNDGIGDYQFLSLYQNYSTYFPYQNGTGILPKGHANPYLQWEETRKLNFGLDLGFLDNRILLTANYSVNRSSNQLVSNPLPLSTGFPNVQSNLPATVQNNSLEFLLELFPIKKIGFSWEASFNITLPKNKLVAFPDLQQSGYSDRTIGESINSIKVFPFIGVNPITGFYQFRNNNGEATSAPDYSTDNSIIINLDPKFYGGFSNNLVYRRFSFGFLIQFTKQTAQNFRFGNTFPGAFDPISHSNQPITLLNRWQQEGDIKNIQKITTSYESFDPFLAAQNSDAGYSDASFIRLKNANISYSIPDKWAKKISLSKASIYFQGQNLLTITKYIGTDPETKQIDALPPLRVFTLGFNLTF